VRDFPRRNCDSCGHFARYSDVNQQPGGGRPSVSVYSQDSHLAQGKRYNAPGQMQYAPESCGTYQPWASLPPQTGGSSQHVDNVQNPQRSRWSSNSSLAQASSSSRYSQGSNMTRNSMSGRLSGATAANQRMRESYATSYSRGSSVSPAGRAGQQHQKAHAAYHSKPSVPSVEARIRRVYDDGAAADYKSEPGTTWLDTASGISSARSTLLAPGTSYSAENTVPALFSRPWDSAASSALAAGGNQSERQSRRPSKSHTPRPPRPGQYTDKFALTDSIKQKTYGTAKAKTEKNEF
jgi:hypothetical protein